MTKNRGYGKRFLSRAAEKTHQAFFRVTACHKGLQAEEIRDAPAGNPSEAGRKPAGAVRSLFSSLIREGRA